ncbi:MAG: DEAD/DEAH box helicase [Spirochaetales bacterium]|nr:MAG: DEAD/DEAH box helicase [Spirochaetales bacterium]
MLNKIRDSLEKTLYEYCEESGFLRPTPFQKTIIPYFLQGKDIIADVSDSHGRSASVLIALALMLTGADVKKKALIITNSEDVLKKIAVEMRKVFHSHKAEISFTVAGLENNIKKEFRQLAKPLQVLAGSSVRVIDHFRRENLSINNVDILVILRKEDDSDGGFEKDLLFIHSKIIKKPQTIIYNWGRETPQELSNLLQRPVILSAENWQRNDIQTTFYVVEDSRHKLKALTNILTELGLTKTLIITKPGSAPAALEKNLSSLGFSCIHSGSHSRNFIDSPADCCIATTKSNLEKEIDSIYNLLYYDIQEDKILHQKALSLLHEGHENPNLILIGTKEELEMTDKSLEANRMTVKREENPTEKEALEESIKKIISAIKEDADPEELNFFKGLIKKHVPLTLRMYFCAYLFKQFSGSKHTKPSKDMQTLFVSVGKNRSIFPRDLAKFFSTALNINQEEIGSIKILDNYSFIEIATSHAQKAIDQLDGKDFKGRKITVNHARKKEEKS